VSEPAFGDLVGDTPAQLTQLLRASVIAGAAATAAAVEMLATAYDGGLLKAPPIREAIRGSDGYVTVDWNRLAELARLMMDRQLEEPDIPDVIDIYRSGLPAGCRHVLAAIAALGDGQLGMREAVILSTAYQHVALASHDWSAADVEDAPRALQAATFSVTVTGDVLDRLDATATAQGVTPIDVIRRALDGWLPGLPETSPADPPSGLARPEGSDAGEDG
jgi:hypothetical protein